MSDKALVQVRLPRDLIKQLDHLCVDLEVTRTALIERFVRTGLAEHPPVHQPPRPIEELLGALPGLTGDLTATEYVRQIRGHTGDCNGND
jgi:hypothetical protein